MLNELLHLQLGEEIQMQGVPRALLLHPLLQNPSSHLLAAETLKEGHQQSQHRRGTHHKNRLRPRLAAEDPAGQARTAEERSEAEGAAEGLELEK